MPSYHQFYSQMIPLGRSMSKDAQTNRKPAEWLATAFKEVDWPIPAYISLGFLTSLAKAVKDAPQFSKLDIMREVLARSYTPKYLAQMFVDRYSKIVHVRDFKRQIDESIRTFFCGYGFNAVTGMVPVVEGIIRKMAVRQNRDVGQGTKKLVDELQALVTSEERSPHCYGERLVMLETFRDFVRDRLLEKTDSYSGLNEFNRHGILHGIFENFGQEINFFRLITLLDLLCFSIGLVEGGVSSFAAPETPESATLAAEYLRLRDFHGTPTSSC
jgi:hypothetical protein